MAVRCLAAHTVTGDSACILGACTRCHDSGLFQILLRFTTSHSLIATKLTTENWWLCNACKTLADPKINVALGSAGATDTGHGSQKVLTNAHSSSAHVFSQYASAAPGLCNFGCLLQHTSWLHRSFYVTTIFKRIVRCRNITNWRRIKGKHNIIHGNECNLDRDCENAM